MTVFVDSGDVERFRGIVAAQFGLQFDDSKLGFLAEVLRKRLEAGPRNSQAYFSELEGSFRASEETSALARELTVGETYFFRNNDQFRAFAEIALPSRIRERASDHRLRLLSAGCASGEEAYSLAILLRETATYPLFDASILAVDINPGALERAAEARFSAWALRETSPEATKRWFRSSGRDFILDPEIRSAVTFEHRNLTSDDVELWRPDFYDVVFCRNVIMYFSPEKMRAVIERIARSLVPGGYLFLGHAETLRGLSQDFHLLHSHDTFYYQRRSEGEAVNLPRREEPPYALRTYASADDTSVSWVDSIARAAERIRALGDFQSPVINPAAEKWNLGHVLDLLQRERFHEALDLLRAMPQAAARDNDVLLLTSVLLAHSGQLAAGAEVASRLLLADELNAGAHYVLGLCYEGAGDRASATHHNHLASYLDPEFAMPRMHLGLLAKRSGDLPTARRELAQALLLLNREDGSRLLLFGGGFTREGLITLCKAELSSIEGRP
jgi:chemotaxis protein methyltransferase CheR